MSQFAGRALLVAFLGLTVHTASAHVALDQPNGGETLEVGSVYTITWHVLIQHDTQNWDLWYSTTGSGGPWIAIATDLPAGDISAGSVHTYDWVVPDDVTDQARVRVRQDNGVAPDYEDISQSDFSIVPGCPEDLDGDGSIGIADLAALLGVYGTCSGDPDYDAAADFNNDGCIGLEDLAQLLAVYGQPCP